MTYLLALFLSATLNSQSVMLDTLVNQDWGMSVKRVPVRLSESEISTRMQSLSDWTTDGKRLFYTRTFDNFIEAIAFVNSLVEPAEKLGHHPDITINYNQVFLELTTHDAQGLTELDFQLASKISQL